MPVLAPLEARASGDCCALLLPVPCIELGVSESAENAAPIARADGAVNNNPSMSEESAITPALCRDLPRGCANTLAKLCVIFFHSFGATPTRSRLTTPVLLLLRLQLIDQTRILSLQALTAVSSAVLSEMPTNQKSRVRDQRDFSFRDRRNSHRARKSRDLTAATVIPIFSAVSSKESS